MAGHRTDSLGVRVRSYAMLPPPSPGTQLYSIHLLLHLQARHAVFGGPVVGRAHAVAAATLAPVRLAANAATAGILADLGLDSDTVAAALLHDALDASPLTRPQLEVQALLSK